MTSGADARPSTVAAAAGALLAAGVLSLVGAALGAGFAPAADPGAVPGLSVRGNTWTGIENSLRIAADVTVVAGVAVALGLVVLAYLAARGRNAARVAAGLAAGPFLGWSLCGLAVSAGVVGYYPGWVRVLLLASQTGAALLYLAAVVLLALPVSNAFFRPAAVTDPAELAERTAARPARPRPAPSLTGDPWPTLHSTGAARPAGASRPAPNSEDDPRPVGSPWPTLHSTAEPRPAAASPADSRPALESPAEPRPTAVPRSRPAAGSGGDARTPPA